MLGVGVGLLVEDAELVVPVDQLDPRVVSLFDSLLRFRV